MNHKSNHNPFQNSTLQISSIHHIPGGKPCNLSQISVDPGQIPMSVLVDQLVANVVLTGALADHWGRR